MTPAQEAQVKIYIARFTAMALRCDREGTTDRYKACLAVENLYRATDRYKKIETYIYLEYTSEKLFRNLKTGETVTIPDGYLPPEDTFYCISGLWPDMVSLARKWTGRDDVSESLCLAQHSMHPAAYADFVVNVLGIKEQEKNAKVLFDFSNDCGVTLQYDNCCLVGDRPVAHLISEDGSGSVQPIFTEKHALEMGLELP